MEAWAHPESSFTFVSQKAMTVSHLNQISTINGISFIQVKFMDFKLRELGKGIKWGFLDTFILKPKV